MMSSLRPLCAVTVSVMVAWSASCSLFQSHQVPPPETHLAPSQAAPVTRPPRPIRSARIRSAPGAVSKPSHPRLSLPQRPSPEPLVTLENSDDAKATAQRLVDQATVNLAHVDRAEIPDSIAPAYQQASELISSAQHAMADQDYMAASSLAEKASALLSQLPSQK